MALPFFNAYRGSIGRFFQGDKTLVGYWQFDGSSIDNSGNGYNGTDTTVSYSPAYSRFSGGQGAYFNGSNSYINLGNVLGSIFVGAHTVSMWVYVKDYSSSREIIAKINTSTTIPTPIDYSIISTGSIRMMFGNNSSYWWIDTNNPITTNKWNHIVFRYDGSGSFAGMSIYLNGVLCPVTINNTFGTPADAAYNLNIGARGNGALPMNGYIDDVAVFSRALSPAEISQYYQWATSAQKKSWYGLLLPSTYSRRRLLLSM
jgi:hypothetical protein